MNIKISILVPVYKVEAYLPRCIESVLSQDFTDYELILVDDGSLIKVEKSVKNMLPDIQKSSK